MTTKTFLAFSCIHCPLQDKDAERWLLDQIAIRRPDYVIHLGDGHEADSASRFPSEYTWTLRDEFESHNNFLRKVRIAYEPAERIFIEGNHDANLLTVNRINKKLRGLCDIYDGKNEPELTTYWNIGTKYEYSSRGIFRLGQVTFGHGYSSAALADEQMTLELGIPYGLWVGGHTHRPIPVTQARKTQRIPLPYWYSNAGCIRTLKPEFAKRMRTSQWGHALVYGEFRELNELTFSREWAAETVVYKMSEPHLL